MGNWDFEEWFFAIVITILVVGIAAVIAVTVTCNHKWNARNRDCVLAGYAGYTTSVTVPSCWKTVDGGNTLMVPYEKVMADSN